MARSNTLLYIGTNRFVAALDPRTGEELWRTKLPKSGSGGPVTMQIKGRNIYAGYNGEVFCLMKNDGSVVWHNKLKGMGYHPILLAMEGASGSSDGAVLAAHEQRRRQSSAGAAAS
ncbi:MAG: PQQ-binding-like beta-propeller repeat protein [Planctomycetota bacterium]|nr:PQQ-binding-like beta-propeller repeat protein [Planctomycetota bacterium]